MHRGLMDSLKTVVCNLLVICVNVSVVDRTASSEILIKSLISCTFTKCVSPN